MLEPRLLLSADSLSDFGMSEEDYEVFLNEIPEVEQDAQITSETFDDTAEETDTGAQLLLLEDFSDGAYDGWTLVDQGTVQGPMDWSAVEGWMVQNSNVHAPTGESISELGTHAYWQGGSSWTDYTTTIKVKSSDDDAIGVMFRYQDENNYYRFSWDKERNSRALVKCEDGRFTILAEDFVPYVTGQSYQLTLHAQGSALQVAIDGRAVFSVTDSTFASGTIALYCWANVGAYFDDITVTEDQAAPLLLSEDFNDGDHNDWIIVDQGTNQGPMSWSVTDGEMVQSSNVHAPTGDSISELGTYAYRQNGFGWTDYTVSATIRSTDDDAIGIMFRYQDENNYYRFGWDKERNSQSLVKCEDGGFTILAENSVPYVTGKSYQVEVSAQGSTLRVSINGSPVLSATDSSFSSGTIALYCWANAGSYFNDVTVAGISGVIQSPVVDNTSGTDTSSNADSSAPTGTVSSIWQPPIGIPAPSFGIDETHHMYQGQTYDFGNGPEPYKDAGNGPYTHYIDNTHPNATDTNNPYGTASMPRLTIPWDLSEGSVVEVHGGPYTDGGQPYYNYWTWFSGNGTRQKPVFIRGTKGQIPVFSGMDIRAGGSYLVIENFDFNDTTIGVSCLKVSDHISFRNLEVHNGPPQYATAISAGQGSHIVIYNNYIHDNGDPNWHDENDFHGVSAGYRNGRHAEYVWIIDNRMHGNGGDSIQINSGNVAINDVARHIYIGRNTMYGEGENAVDLKSCADVVVSENIMYGFQPSNFAHSGSDGTAMVVNDEGAQENIWVMYNEIHDSTNAIRSEGDAYLIGNNIYNIHKDPAAKYGGNAVITWPAHDLHIVDNTIHNVDRGIEHCGGGIGKAVYVHNNIISLSSSGEFHIDLTGAVSANSLVSNNVFYSSSGKAIINWNGVDTQWDIMQFRQFTSQGDYCVEAATALFDPANDVLYMPDGSPVFDDAVVSYIYQMFSNLYGIDVSDDSSSS